MGMGSELSFLNYQCVRNVGKIKQESPSEHSSKTILSAKKETRMRHYNWHSHSRTRTGKYQRHSAAVQCSALLTWRWVWNTCTVHTRILLQSLCFLQSSEWAHFGTLVCCCRLCPKSCVLRKTKNCFKHLQMPDLKSDLLLKCRFPRKN